jgi:type II secretory pathway component PulJ
MPGGYTIIEMLGVILITPLLMVLIGGFLVTFLRDIPQATRLLDQNTAVLDVLNQLRHDMDRAVALPSQAGDRRTDDATLLIRQADALVCYRLEEGRIVRMVLDRSEEVLPDVERIWQAHDAVIQWRPWVREGGAYAVEVQSHLRQRVAGEFRQRFRNSHVFFVGGLASGGDMQ